MESTRSRIGGADASPRAPRPGVRRAGALVAAMVAAFALVSCTPTEQPAVVATPTPTPVETAEPTPTPTETEAPINTLPAELEPQANASIEEFAAMPKEAQLQYALQLATVVTEGHSTATLEEFEAGYYSMSGNALDRLPVATPNNTAQEAVTLSGTNNRFSLSLLGTDREKFLIAIHLDGMESAAYKAIKPLIDTAADGLTGTAAGYLEALPVETVLDATDITQDDQGRTYRDITMQSVQDYSGTDTQRFYFIQINNGSSSFSTWTT